ncbi:hypothetical protein H4R33_005993 [Dimargaris cristalligena]|uniref:Cation efflux protein n=1 Tax=Dimargaris cristalligena TaxID=215637 RepID=A0A4Q0A130_9FUNG|nr:hypothetical protein H4R33_005993 [Dimargaris cristalligena]RKP39151.1 cation efflux protein [Dimargaris cristalligena]|eukprot:RKP39151.1 cation efflux protein [Dimargaris cristalligena]
MTADPSAPQLRHRHPTGTGESTEPTAAPATISPEKEPCPPPPSWPLLLRQVWTTQWGLVGAFLLQVGLVLSIWLVGLATGSLATVAYAYWLLFNAASLLIVAIQRALFSHPTLRGQDAKSNKRVVVGGGGDTTEEEGVLNTVAVYPFGWRRLPVILTFAQLLYMLFVATHILTESIKHNLDPEAHHSFDDHHHEFLGQEGTVESNLLVLGSMLTTLLFVVVHQIDHFSTQAITASSALHHPAAAPVPSSWRAALGNRFITLSLVSGALILIKPWLLSPPLSQTVDPYLAIILALAMVLTSVPYVTRIGTILLQAGPEQTHREIKQRLSEICQWPEVRGYRSFRLWANTTEELVGTVEFMVHTNCGDQGLLLQRIRGYLSPPIHNLTVQINLE